MPVPVASSEHPARSHCSGWRTWGPRWRLGGGCRIDAVLEVRSGRVAIGTTGLGVRVHRVATVGQQPGDRELRPSGAVRRRGHCDRHSRTDRRQVPVVGDSFRGWTRHCERVAAEQQGRGLRACVSSGWCDHADAPIGAAKRRNDQDGPDHNSHKPSPRYGRMVTPKKLHGSSFTIWLDGRCFNTSPQVALPGRS